MTSTSALEGRGRVRQVLEAVSKSGAGFCVREGHPFLHRFQERTGHLSVVAPSVSGGALEALADQSGHTHSQGPRRSGCLGGRAFCGRELDHVGKHNGR